MLREGSRRRRGRGSGEAGFSDAMDYGFLYGRVGMICFLDRLLVCMYGVLLLQADSPWHGVSGNKNSEIGSRFVPDGRQTMLRFEH